MKNRLFLPILLIAIILNCHEVTAQVRVVDSSSPDENTAPGVVPSNIGLNDIVLNKKDHTWTDLDSFYQNVVLSKAQESYFSNLKK